jgi:hypothetical protein
MSTEPVNINEENKYIEPDENFDHELVYDDPGAELYKSIVARREKLNSVSRFIWHTAFMFCFLASTWALLVTRSFWWLWGMVLFFLLANLNAQVLNYRGLLSSLPPLPIKKEK